MPSEQWYVVFFRIPTLPKERLTICVSRANSYVHKLTQLRSRDIMRSETYCPSSHKLLMGGGIYG